MNNKIYMLAILLFSINMTHAQAPDWVWARSAGSTLRDHGSDITTDKAGNIYVTGYFYDSSITFGSVTLTGTGSALAAHFFIAKYDPSGNVIWAKSPGGMDHEGINSVLDAGITTDELSNVYATGNFKSPIIIFGRDTLTNTNSTDSTSDVFIVKYDSSGNVLWAKSGGGINEDVATSISIDAVANIYIAGSFDGPNVIFGNDTLTKTENTNIFVVKYSSSGKVLWAKTDSGTRFSYATGLSNDSAGNVCITGYFFGRTISFGNIILTNKDTVLANPDIFIVKYDSSGNVKWAKSAGGTDFDYSFGSTSDEFGNEYVAGYFFSQTIDFGGIVLTNPGFVFGAGNPSSIFIAKYNSSGNIIWAKNSAGNTADNVGFNATTDPAGNVYVSGFFYGPIIVFGNDTLTGTSNPSLFIVKYDTSGNVLWAKTAHGAGFCYASTIDPHGNLYTTGTFIGTTLILGNDTLHLPNDTDDAIFIAKLNSIVTGIGVVKSKNTVLVFPNPASDQITISFPANKKREIQIINLLGQIVFSENLSADYLAPITKIGISQLPKGMYLITVTNSSGKFESKFLKQ